jgi:hypothetical protein
LAGEAAALVTMETTGVTGILTDEEFAAKQPQLLERL